MAVDTDLQNAPLLRTVIALQKFDGALGLISFELGQKTEITRIDPQNLDALFSDRRSDFQHRTVAAEHDEDVNVFRVVHVFADIVVYAAFL